MKNRKTLWRILPTLIAGVLFLLLSGCGEEEPASNETRGEGGSGTRGFTTGLPKNVEAGKRVAIVIGNDEYESLPAKGQLRVAVQDARLMAETLESLDPPFVVTLLENAAQDEAETALEEFIDSALNAECALFYFAGHGIEYHGSNFLLTRDTKLAKKAEDVRRMKRILGNETIEVQSVVDDLEATEAGVKVVILDACRDNPVEVVSAGPGGQRSVLGGKNGGLAQVAAPSGMYVSYSADADQQANDGLFTGVLCRQMKREGVDIVRVFAATREEVLRESKRMNKENPRRWVVHEPAEYNKLNEAGTRFRFNGGLSKTERKLAELQAKLAEQERLFEEKAKEKEAESLASEQPIVTIPATKDDGEMEKLKERLAKMQKELEEAKSVGEGVALLATPKKPVSPSVSSEDRELKPLPKARPKPEVTMPVLPNGNFSAGTRSMEGSKAGETRTMGGIEMVWCPPGEFLMGSPESEESRGDDEKQHRVELTKGFWMAKTECTQSQWESAMGSNPSKFQGPKRPVEQVSWDDCQEWLVKMNAKQPLPEGWKWVLPSEAQWEYACRAGTETVFAFGNSLNSEQANFIGEFPYGGAAKGPSLGETTEVGSYQANGWGLLDMHGNVWEWCADYYDGDYYSDGQRDPEGPNAGSDRVRRGGSWDFIAFDCRSAYRFWFTPDDRYDFLGFRPVVSSKP